MRGRWVRGSPDGVSERGRHQRTRLDVRRNWRRGPIEGPTGPGRIDRHRPIKLRDAFGDTKTVWPVPLRPGEPTGAACRAAFAPFYGIRGADWTAVLSSPLQDPPRPPPSSPYLAVTRTPRSSAYSVSLRGQLSLSPPLPLGEAEPGHGLPAFARCASPRRSSRPDRPCRPPSGAA